MPRTGRCLCGGVSFTAEPMPAVQACHCESCRKWGGGPFLSVPCKEAAFEGAVSRYALTEHADRAFCPTCGTHLYFYAKAQDVHAIPAGLFDDASGMPFRAEVFIDEKPDYYDFANETRRMTGAEYVEKFR